MKEVNFGIIGTGAIATQFIKEASKIKGINILGVSARKFEKTKDFAKQYNIPNPCSSSDELLSNQDIDAIYIATFHPTHWVYAIKALEAGKHVLCEKPAALNKETIKKITHLACEKELLFMEAITVGFNPLYQKIKSEINKGSIGRIVHVESSFGRVSKKIHKHNPKQAGGALYDIGIYNIFLMVDLLGVPTEVHTISRDNPWGVEGSVSCLSKHLNGSTSSFYATMDSLSNESAKIIGTKGVIEIPSSWTIAKKFILKTIDGKVNIFQENNEAWLGHEIKSFRDTLINNNIENSIMSLKKSISLHETIDLIKKDLGFKYEEVDLTTY